MDLDLMRVVWGTSVALLAQLGLMLAWFAACLTRGMPSGAIVHAMMSPGFLIGSLILGFLTELLGGWLAGGGSAQGAMARAAVVGGLLTLLEGGWIALESGPVAALSLAGLFTPIPAALLGGSLARGVGPRAD